MYRMVGEVHKTEVYNLSRQPTRGIYRAPAFHARPAIVAPNRPDHVPTSALVFHARPRLGSSVGHGRQAHRSETSAWSSRQSPARRRSVRHRKD